MSRILLIDDEASIRHVLAVSLRKDGYTVTAVQSAAEALEILHNASRQPKDTPVDLIITDLKMPGMSGMELLAHVNANFEHVPVLVLTAHGTVDSAVSALKQGASDFISKPFDRDEMRMVVKKALQQREKSAHGVGTQPDDTGINALVGHSSHMRAVHEMIDTIADTPSTVLITGESGTGKELVARAIHLKSKRRDKPHIRINCAAIPETLIESELFGYEKGAFTGAVTSKPGRFELAHGGTLFLDEIGDLPIETQVKLLRVLQESTFERVGGIKTIHMDVRLVAATNQNLSTAIKEGRFREDLFYRLNVVPIVLPPLRERLEDLPALVAHFVRKHNVRLSKQIVGFTPLAIAQLQQHKWPGNIRELENIVERTMLFARSNTIDAQDLPVEVGGQPIQVSIPTIKTSLRQDISLKEMVRESTAQIEKELIICALDETQGNVTHAARKLKISRKGLQIKMKELGLRDEEESNDFMSY